MNVIKNKQLVFSILLLIGSLACGILHSHTVTLDAPPVIDGAIDDVWDSANAYKIKKIVKNSPADEGPGESDLSAQYRALWDQNNFYLLVEVKDDKIYNGITTDHHNDNIEVYVDLNNSKLSVYDGIDDDQIRFVPEVDTINSKRGVTADKINMAYVATVDGYLFEIMFPWNELTTSSFEPKEDVEIGFDIMVTDNDGSEKKDYILAWNAPNNDAWKDATVFGILKLKSQGLLEKVISEYIPPDHDELDIDESKAGLFLFVDQNHMNASDENPGDDPMYPLSTITKALDIACDSAGKGIAAKVEISPGTYRESGLNFIKKGNANKFMNTEIIIEGSGKGEVIISGAEIWNEGWSNYSVNTWVHNWPYKMVPKRPWGDHGPEAEIAHRREMVFVNGMYMKQVMQLDELEENSFCVDEEQDKLYVKVSSEINFEAVDKEISLHGDGEDAPWPPRRLITIPAEKDKVVLRNLVFEYANMRMQEATVKINGWKVLIENCIVRWNNGVGINIGSSKHVRILNSNFDHNGGTGIMTWGARKMYLENTTSSFNNWRGAQGNFHSYAVGGCKFHHTRGLTLMSHVSSNNRCPGLWTDLEIMDVLYENCTVENNYGPGLLIEISQDVQINNSVIRKNTPGIRCHSSRNVTFDSCTIEGNTIQFSVYKDHRDFSDPNWTNQFEGRIWDKTPENWTIKNSTITAIDDPEWQTEWEKRIPSWIHYTSPGYQSFWHFSHDEYMRTFFGQANIAYNNNEWTHPVKEKPFKNDEDEELTTEEWEYWISNLVLSEEAIDKIDSLVINNHISDLNIEILEDAGLDNIINDNIEIYKEIMANEESIPDLKTLSNIIDKANALKIIREMAVNDDASALTADLLLDCGIRFRNDRIEDYKVAIVNEDEIPNIEYLQEVIDNAPLNNAPKSMQNVNIYPNPFRDKIILKNIQDYSTASLINSLGQLVYIYDIDDVKDHVMDTPELQKGIYIIKLDGKHQYLYKHIIKK